MNLVIALACRKYISYLVLAFCVMATFSISPTQASDKKLVIAHRGASAYLPEHTLAAKAMAHAMGADFIEQDVVLTRDGVAIILHDIHLDTVSDVAKRFPDRKRDDGRYYAIDFSLKEIKTLSVHERTRKGTANAVFAKRFPVTTAIFGIPTLVEEIELVRGLNHSTGRDVGIFPEIKNPQFHLENGQDISKIVIEILSSYGYQSKKDKIILQCFDWQETKRIRNQLGYQGRLVQLLAENRWGVAKNTDFDQLKSEKGIKQIAQIADGIGPWINQIIDGSQHDAADIKTKMLKDAQAAGLTIYPYTARADALPKWAKDFPHLLNAVLFEAGADGVFTDFPDLAVSFLKQRAEQEN